MRPLSLAFLLLVALLAAACGDTDVSTATAATAPLGSSAPGTTEPSSPSGSASVSSSATPAPEPDVQLPADAPTLVDEPADIERIAEGDLAPLAPPRADITFTALQTAPNDPVDQIALAWRRGGDPFSSTQGLVVWQRFEGPAWRALYAFTDRPSTGVLGITLSPGDVTRDGIADLLTNELTGGTGACGRWRVVASEPGRATEIFRRDACDTEIRIAGGDVQLRAAVFEPDDAHCCPSAFRVTTLRWDGESWQRTSSELQPVASG